MGKSYKRLKQEIHELKNQLDVKSNRIAVLLLAKSALEDKVAKLSKKRVFKVKFRTTDEEKVTHKAIDGTEFDTLLEVVEHNEKLPTIKEKSDSLAKKVCSNQMCQGVWCDCDNKESDSLKYHIDPEKELQALESQYHNCLISYASYIKQKEKLLNKMPIEQDPEKFEAFLSKVASRVKTPCDVLISKFSFNEDQVEFIIDSFGLEEAEKVLDLCQILNINPLSLKK